MTKRSCLLLVAAGLMSGVAGCDRNYASTPKANTETVAKMRRADALGASAGPEDTGTGWGTLTGQIVFTGTPPAMAAIDRGAKAAECAVPLKYEVVEVNPSNKGLKNALVYLVTKKPRVHPDYVGGKEVLWDQKQCRFLDHVAGVYMKDKWVILNGDTAGHNAFGNPSGSDPFNQSIAIGGRYEYPGFNRELTMPFIVGCSIHPWMKAWVIARNDPYFAVTDQDGKFTIPNVPAGTELTFQVWHEGAAGGTPDKGALLSGTANWQNNGAGDGAWKNGRFKLKVEDGQTATLTGEVGDDGLNK